MSFVVFSGTAGKVSNDVNKWLDINVQSKHLELIVHHMNTVSTDVGTILVCILFSYVQLQEDDV